MPVLNLAITASSDDAVELPTQAMLLTALLLQNSNPGAFIGLRFSNVTIPNGAMINSATLIGDIYDTVRDSPAFNAHCQDIDNAPTFSAISGDISSRTLTTEFVTIVAIDVGDGPYSFPDMSNVIQEVIDRPGWVSGNSIVVILDGLTGGDSHFISWDGSGANGDPFKLDIDYTENSSNIIEPNVVLNINTLYDPALYLEIVSDRLDNINSFYDPALYLEMVSDRLDNINSFYDSALYLEIVSDRLDNVNPFYDPIVTQTSGVYPDRVDNQPSVYDISLQLNVYLGTIINTNTVYDFSTILSISPILYQNDNDVYEPIVTISDDPVVVIDRYDYELEPDTTTLIIHADTTTLIIHADTTTYEVI
jgi:hypothetical protein